MHNVGIISYTIRGVCIYIYNLIRAHNFYINYASYTKLKLSLQLDIYRELYLIQIIVMIVNYYIFA